MYRYQVSFSDVDFARVLFFARYFEIVNRASEDWFHQHGLYFRDLLPQMDLAMPIVATYCRYLGAIRLEEVVEVHLGVTELSPRGFSMPFVFFRQGEERSLAWGYLERRFVNGQRQAQEAPSDIQRLLEAMAQESRRFVEETWQPLASRHRQGPATAEEVGRGRTEAGP